MAIGTSKVGALGGLVPGGTVRLILLERLACPLALKKFLLRTSRSGKHWLNLYLLRRSSWKWWHWGCGRECREWRWRWRWRFTSKMWIRSGRGKSRSSWGRCRWYRGRDKLSKYQTVYTRRSISSKKRWWRRWWRWHYKFRVYWHSRGKHY
jgi:hypothetical protein